MISLFELSVQAVEALETLGENFLVAQALLGPAFEDPFNAEAGFAPHVRVPVRIVLGRTTIVNLEHGVANRVPVGADQKAIIRGPNGMVIGWTAAR